MKKMRLAILLGLLILSLSGCAKTYRGTGELIAKAREELPVPEAETADVRYAGMCAQDDRAVAWFIYGGGDRKYGYLPMEIKVKGQRSAKYKFVKILQPVTGECEDIAAVNWNQGCAFLINNPDCAAVRITDENGTYEEKISHDAYPYVFYHSPLPSAYVFLDADGNELP